MVWVQLVIAVVLFVAGSLIRKPPEVNPAAFEDFGFPDIDPTKRIPIIWGKKRVKSVHTMEVQGYRTRAIRRGNFIKKNTVGFRYYATVAVGICRGPNVPVTKILLGDKVLWEGTATPTDSGYEITVARGDFNGKDDGVGGTIRIYPGSGSQTVNAELAAQHALSGGGDAFPDIAYRGICYAVFEDFYWGNSPTIGQLEFVVERYPDTLGLGNNRLINTTPNESPSQGAVDLAIPEIVHEVLTNQTWGLGESISQDIDSTLFTSVASVLRSEGNAASLIWNQGDSVRELLGILMRQIDGFVFKRMASGLWEMNLARDDYSTGSPVNNGDVIHFDETNSSLIRYNRGNWEETFNIVNVQWQDRDLKGKPSPATVQDLANFSIQGSHQEATYNFPGVHSATLAANLASKQLKASSYPLATAEITTHRLAFALVPGDIVEFGWDKLSITRIFMRVNKISLGTPEQGEIRISLVQDVFGLADTVYGAPQGTFATSQGGEPQEVALALVEDQSAFLASQDPDNASDAEKPRILAGAPQGNALQYVPYEKLSTESAFAEVDAEFGYALNGTLQADLAPEDGDLVSMVVEGVSGAFDLTSPASLSSAQIKELGDGLLLIQNSASPTQLWTGDTSPQHGEYEILAYSNVSVSGSTVTLTNVRRALEDTAPMRAKAGDTVWFMSGFMGTTVDVYNDADIVDIRLENQTSSGVSDISNAVNHRVQMRRRLDRPLVPGGLEIGSSNNSPETIRYPGQQILPSGDLLFTWKRRDKNNSSMYYQTDADDNPGADYIVDLDIYSNVSGTATFLRTISGNAASATYTRAMQQTDGTYNRYMVVLRAYDESFSPRLASLSLIRQKFRYNPLISPLPSPIPDVSTSPTSPRFASPHVSPVSPVPSPISPVPSPTSPFPFLSPQSPLPSPTRSRSPLPSPISPQPSPVSPVEVALYSPRSPQAAYVSGYRGYIISEGPDAYWSLDDDSFSLPGSPGEFSPGVTRSVREEINSLTTVTHGGVASGNFPLTRGSSYSYGAAQDADSYIEVSDDAVLDFADTWSIEFWLLQGRGTGASDNGPRYFARSATSHEFEVRVVDEDSSPNPGHLHVLASGLSLYSSKRVDDGRPHQISITQDVSGGNAPYNLYIDGILDAQSGNLAKPAASANPLYMLGRPTDGTPFGQMAHCAIYSKQLTNAEILDHYMEGRRWEPFYSSVLKSGPTGWWRTRDAVTNSVPDWIGTAAGTSFDTNQFDSGGPLVGQPGTYFETLPDSPNSYISLGDNPYVTADQEIGGLAIWFRHTNLGSPGVSNVSLAYMTSSTADTYIRFQIANDGGPEFLVRHNTSANQADFIAVNKPAPSPENTVWGIGSLADGEWHMAAVVKRSAGAMPLFYVDGVEYASAVNLAGTGAATDWIHDVSVGLRWAFGARVTTANAISNIFGGDLAEPMYWDGSSGVPTAEQMMEIYTSGIANFRSMTDRLVDMRPVNAFELSDDDAALPDLMGDMVDGVFAGTTRDIRQPLSADDTTQSVEFVASADGRVTFTDGLLETEAALASPVGRMPNQHTLVAIGVHKEASQDPASVAGRQVLLANHDGSTNLNTLIEVGHAAGPNQVTHDTVPETSKSIGTRGGTWRQGQARMVTYIQNAKTQGFNSPLDDTYRRIMLDGVEVQYVDKNDTSPLDGTDDRNYIEAHDGAGHTVFGIGRYVGATTGQRNWDGIISHVAAYDRVLTGPAQKRLALRRLGWQEFPLEVMKYDPVLYWRCNDDADAIYVADYSGNDRHATPQGNVVLNSVSENSQLWHEDNGVFDSSASPQGGALIATTTLNLTATTLGGWFKLDTDLDSVELGFVGSDVEQLFQVVWSGAGSPGPVFQLNTRTPGDALATNTGTVQAGTYGTWHFVGAAISADGGSVDLYIDGELVETLTVGSPGFSATYTRFALGTRLHTSPLTLATCKAHDVFVLPQKLTNAEIREIYAASFAPSHDILVEALGASAYWKLNEWDGDGKYLNTVPDASGHYLVASEVATPVITHGSKALLSRYPENSLYFGPVSPGDATQSPAPGIDTLWDEYPVGTNAWSVSCWLELGSNPHGTIWDFGNTSGAGQAVSLTINAAGSPLLLRLDFVGSTLDYALPAAGAKTHVLVRLTGTTSQTAEVYFNGVLQSTVATSNPTQAVNIVQGSNLYIGKQTFGTTAAQTLSDVYLSRVAVFPSSLTVAQIEGLSDSGNLS